MSILDLFCSINWRLELDQDACPIWRYDFDHSGNCQAGFDGPINYTDAGDRGN